MKYLIIYCILWIITFSIMVYMFRHRNLDYKICRNFDWAMSEITTPNDYFFASFFIANINPIVIVFIIFFICSIPIDIILTYLDKQLTKLNSKIFNIPFKEE